MKTIHIKITGRVQGVFFRAKAREKALPNNLRGWIKNTDEGHVEAIVTGEEKDLAEFIAWCHQGPEKARVVNVLVTPLEKQIFNDFNVIR
ncbi:MAG: acylphosphatase [Bacteroidota bacterium]|nr:acylphosphatase [Bacteroidota bacterium]